MTNPVPYYLFKKLSLLELADIAKIKQLGYMEVFTQLKLIYPSLTYSALIDLYCLNWGILRATLSKQQQRQLISNYKNRLPSYSVLSASHLEYYLDQALQQALLAVAANEVPIGAVVVLNERIIGYGYNQTKSLNSITAHAEIIALQQASQYIGSYRLTQCDLYVTIEPCLMCSGAIINSRIRRLIFGAVEPKTGACISQHQIFKHKLTNPHCQIIGPVNPSKYSFLIQDFFCKQRL